MTSATTRAVFVLGNPVKHSRSPKLHWYWLKRYRIAGDYRIEERDEAGARALLSDVGGHGYVGGNVTLPFKELALAVTEPDARARSVGAANTVWLDGGRLRSTNTDVEGFVRSLDVGRPGWESATRAAVVLGAGGAARAVVCGLVERGVSEIHVVNRTLERARRLRADLGPAIRAAAWGDVPDLLKGCRLLVNTTSLGMKGQPPLAVDLADLHAEALVSDIVYVPLETGLLRAARERGLRTANGLDMLLFQAVRGFSLWFGIEPEVTAEQRALLAADIPAA